MYLSLPKKFESVLGLRAVASAYIMTENLHKITAQKIIFAFYAAVSLSQVLGRT